MNCKSLRFPILFALFALTASAAWASGTVQVCHIPPGNPDNFNTITVGQDALQTHLDHGDLVGGCSANCDVLCSEDHPCTTGECACPCVDGIPHFIEALNGQFGLTDCKAAVNVPGVAEYALLVLGDATFVGTQVTASTPFCGFLSGKTMDISLEQLAVCSALVRQKAAAAGLTCTPF